MILHFACARLKTASPLSNHIYTAHVIENGKAVCGASLKHGKIFSESRNCDIGDMFDDGDCQRCMKKVMSREKTKPMMKVYAVYEGGETQEGDSVDEYSGYTYATKDLADIHAASVWRGSVKELTVIDVLPEYIKQRGK